MFAHHTPEISGPSESGAFCACAAVPAIIAMTASGAPNAASHKWRKSERGHIFRPRHLSRFRIDANRRVVFGADILVEIVVGLGKGGILRPWPGKSAGIFYIDVDLQRLAALDHVEAFDDMQSIGMGCAENVHHGHRF